MAPKVADSVFFCTECGSEAGKWLGQCPVCGAWNTMVAGPAPERRRPRSESGVGGQDGAGRGRSGRNHGDRGRGGRMVPVTEAVCDSDVRVSTGIEGVDRVLGGGLVPGSLVLLAGEPGIGKSTLILQVAAALGRDQAPAIYVSGEESARQVALRAQRTGCAVPNLMLLPETSCQAILRQLQTLSPAAVIVDSVQTMVVAELEAAAGSVSQVRQVAARFQALAKTGNVPVILVGHVNKEGMIAGPKLLEHLVDVVLSLEGEPGHDLRLLRAVKNRFGTVAELALFSMTGAGLQGVRNASAWLLADRQRGAAGSVVAAALEGTAPLLVEVQALVVPTVLGTPRRVVQGLEGSRLALLLAVLERATGVGFGDKDVFVNLVGGLSLREPALDLAVAAALLSSASNVALAPETVVFGEVGLLGEVRAVSRAAIRVREAAALGFTRALVPARDAEAETLALPVDGLRHVDELPRLLVRDAGPDRPS